MGDKTLDKERKEEVTVQWVTFGWWGGQTRDRERDLTQRMLTSAYV